MENNKGSLFANAQGRLVAAKNGEEASRLANEEIFRTEVYPEILRMKEIFIKKQLPAIYLPLVKEIKDLTNTEITTNYYLRFFAGKSEDPTENISSLAPENNSNILLSTTENKQQLANLWNRSEFKKNTSIYVLSTGWGIDLHYGKIQYDQALFRYLPENGRSIVAKNTTEEELNKFVEEILTSIKNGDHIKRCQCANDDIR